MEKSGRVQRLSLPVRLDAGTYVITPMRVSTRHCASSASGISVPVWCGRHQCQTLELDLGADETVFIYVDGWSNSSNLNGTFVTIDAVYTEL